MSLQLRMQMAVKQYGYYFKGSKLALVEKDTSFDNDVTSKEYGPGSDRAQWKSPKSTIEDGLEIQYTYTPDYTIDETEDVNTAIDTYVSLDGLLKIIDQGDDDYSASPESLSDGSYIVLKKAGRFNGLHKVKAAGVGYITLYTRYSGSATVQKAFEEAPEFYYNISVLEDESFDIDLPDYMCKAIVWYLKAREADDQRDIQSYEYYMARFRKQLEEFKAIRHPGPKMVSSFWHLR